MVKVLFVSSGNSKDGINPIVLNQGESIAGNDVALNYFTVQGKGLRAYFFAIFRLRRELKYNSYDVIHAHYALCGLVALFARRREKLVLSFMGDDLLGSNRPGGAVSKRSLILASINRLVAELFFNACIVKSPEMWDKYGASKKKILLANGVDVEKFKPAAKAAAMERVGFDPKKRHVIFVSDPSRIEKNYRLAVEALTHINDAAIVLHPVYGKPASMLADYYNAADTLLMTSFHEGSPNVVKEAMACNCPVVCTPVGDVQRLFDGLRGHYVTGFEAKKVKEDVLAAIAFRTSYSYTDGRIRLAALQLDASSVAEKIKEIYRSITKKN